MKRILLSALFVLSIFGNVAFAQGTDALGNQTSPSSTTGNTQSISGDALCGGSVNTICKPSDLKTLFARLIPILVAAVTLVVFFYFVWFILEYLIQGAKGNTRAFADAKQKLGNLIVTFVLAVLLLTGFFMVVLRGIGVKEDFLTLMKLFFSVSFIPHAYAAASELPSALQQTSIYDIVLGLFSALLRFLVYPIIIFCWVLAGFKFVTAQGNPKEINSAKKWLTTVFIATILIFMAQGLMLGIRGTINNILGDKAAQTNLGTNSTSAPATPTSPGAACEKDGMYGQRGADGTCYYGGVRGGSTAPQVEDPKIPGTKCTDGVLTGQYGNDGVCYYGGTR